jgi:hypothetical protein
MQVYHELSAYLLMNPDLTFRAQHAVDAYGAQHSGGVTKRITTAFSLIGLYLALECGYTGRQVQLAHMELAKQSVPWPSLNVPTRPYTMFVSYVVAVHEGSDRENALMRWAKHVWDAWEHQHEWTKSICERYLERGR